MSEIKIGQIWERIAPFFEGNYDVIVLQVGDYFVWYRYVDEEDFSKETRSDFLKIFRLKSDPSSLNDKQQIVLEFLKSKVTEYKETPIDAFFILGKLWQFRRLSTPEERVLLLAYRALDSRKQAQVIEVFGKWAQEQEEAE